MPGLHTRDQPAIYRGPLPACSALIRPTAQGDSGRVRLEAFHREECPLLPSRRQHSSRATFFGGKRATSNISREGGSVSLSDTDYSSIFSLISRDSIAWGNFFFLFYFLFSSHIQLPVTVTVIFSMQATALRFFFFNLLLYLLTFFPPSADTLSQWKHDLSALQPCLHLSLGKLEKKKKKIGI